jgi:hypothetical protein
MSTRKLFDRVLRAIGVIAGLWLIYWLWNNHLTPAAGLLVGLGGVLIARWMYRQKVAPNPFGDAERNFALRPVSWDLLKSAGCLAATFLWAISGGLAARYHKLPDTKLAVYGFFGVPLLALFLAFVFFLGRAGVRAMYGISSKPTL